MKVSIIMPVYNSKNYLSKAVNSVLAQDFSDFELILVDDGSTDGSYELCDKFANENDKVKVIHKKNGGICSARNAGLEAAIGDYIGFCDNDDEYLPNLISDNYKIAAENDLCLMRYAKIKVVERDDGKTWTSVSKFPDLVIEKQEFEKNYYDIRREDTVWTGLYKREIIEKNNLRFDESFKYGSEDLSFNLKFLKYCKRLGFNSKAYYRWTQRYVHSTSRSFHREFLRDKMVTVELEYELMKYICGEGKELNIDSVMKNKFMVNTYIAPLVEYMLIKNCDMTMKEKCEYLNELRNHPIFDKELKKDVADKIKKQNKRLYMTLKLFYDRRFKTLFFILGNGTKILSLFRFKGGK